MFAAEFHYLLSTLLSTIKDDCVWVLKFENIITQTLFSLGRSNNYTFNVSYKNVYIVKLRNFISAAPSSLSFIL